MTVLVTVKEKNDQFGYDPKNRIIGGGGGVTVTVFRD